MIANTRKPIAFVLVIVVGLFVTESSFGGDVALVVRSPDPNGSPRPAKDSTDVPLRTSIYLELASTQSAKSAAIDPDSVSITLKKNQGETVPILTPRRRFSPGFSGKIAPKQDFSGGRSLAVYIEPAQPLEPSTRYTITVFSDIIRPKDKDKKNQDTDKKPIDPQSKIDRPAAGRSGSVSKPAPEAGSWSFTTEAKPSIHPITLPLDLSQKTVEWHGAFFSGLCNVVFCTQDKNYGPTYELMAQSRKLHPRAWSYQRDFWPTGMDHRPPTLLADNLPNIVRERETRRIAAIKPTEKGASLRVEDFFGHEQYGIPSNRKLSDDYHPGDEVLIADGVHDARSKVVAVKDDAATVIVTPFANPEEGWKIDYEGELPDREDPDAPGFFPPGGCYLRKYAPHGTACYYWGRLDKEWDRTHQKFGRRLMVNFADAAGDLSRDGRNWTTPKDYVQWHHVAEKIAGHVIDRYGKASLDFTWSVFNEPDLGALFWRADWNELQKFYDYTSDAILRAFEDRGYDSNRVFIGGLELGGIFGVNLRLREFLAHCSPRARAEGAVPLNAAFADPRLEAKRSKRVETLCREHNGKGAPCDFISIHSYNRAEIMAAKLIQAKKTALDIDADYYKNLWINSHESCPDWAPPPDEAAADMYKGDGYFPTWCLDVVHRMLVQADQDPRFSHGETILTVWPPPEDFAGMNAITRIIRCDDDGDGRSDRTLTVPTPIFHALALLSDMGNRYHVLRERNVGGCKIAGFASRGDLGVLRVLVFTHDTRDTQSRSDSAYDVSLEIDGLLDARKNNQSFHLIEYLIDRDHNSPYRLIKELESKRSSVRAEATVVDRLTRELEQGDADAKIAAIDKIRALDSETRREFAGSILKTAGETRDQRVRDAALKALIGGFGPPAYSRHDIERISEKTACKPTAETTINPDSAGKLHAKIRLATNGCAFFVIKPDEVK